MNKETILDLITEGESETVEFKSAFDQATIETLAAFANTKGGYVFKTTQKTTQKTSTKDQILDMLRENPNLTRSEMAQLLGKSQNTIKDHLAALKSEKRVERIGSDRDGYWRVK